jgi:hypothetical protein
MSAGAMSLKAQIRNLAKKKNIKAQVLLQTFVFERFLERLTLPQSLRHEKISKLSLSAGLTY